MPDLSELAWSDDVTPAGWLVERFAAATPGVVTGIVPSGFEAYARVLHPAEEPSCGDGRLVRWRDIASWSHLPLGPSSQFHSVALPPSSVGSPPPWAGQGPREGSLYPPDAVAMAAVLRAHTGTPERCWFCLWDGYGWQGALLTTGGPSTPSDDPVPDEVQRGPRVELPDRSYLLYRGPVEAALIGRPGRPPDQTANLWWPDDHAWCVASEIDLAWTYVGGSTALVEALVSDPSIEALAVSADARVAYTEAWVREWIDRAVDDLLVRGRGTITTPVGMLEASLDRPARLRRGTLRTRTMSVLGHDGTGTHVLPRMDDGGLRDRLASYLEADVTSMVGG